MFWSKLSDPALLIRDCSIYFSLPVKVYILSKRQCYKINFVSKKIKLVSNSLMEHYLSFDHYNTINYLISGNAPSRGFKTKSGYFETNFIRLPPVFLKTLLCLNKKLGLYLKANFSLAINLVQSIHLLICIIFYYMINSILF